MLKGISDEYKTMCEQQCANNSVIIIQCSNAGNGG